MNDTNAAPKRRGCLFWGGIIAGTLLLFMVLLGVGGFYYVKHLINEYTDTKPLAMPAVQLSDAEVKILRDRVDSFDRDVKVGKLVEPLILTADEINALIAKNNKSSSPVLFYFNFNDDRVQAQLSMPLDGIGLRILRGRYFNGSGDFLVSLRGGRLWANVQSLSIKGRQVPDRFMQGIRMQNFADAWTNNADFNSAVAKLKEIKIENGKLSVVPKPAELETGK
jgi:hypothetical protein